MNIVDIRAAIASQIITFVNMFHPPAVIDNLDLSHIVVELDEFEYGPYTTNNVTPQLINGWTFTNNGPTQITQQFTQAASAQLTETWSVTQGMTIGISIGLPVNPIMTGSSSVTLSFSETQAVTKTTTLTDTNSTTILIAPKTTTTIDVTLLELEISVPWTAKIKLSGTFYYNGHSDPSPNEHNSWYGNPPPTIGKWFNGWGIPPGVQVLDDNTILFNAQGLYSGVHGQSWKWDINSVPLDPSFKKETSFRNETDKNGLLSVTIFTTKE